MYDLNQSLTALPSSTEVKDSENLAIAKGYSSQDMINRAGLEIFFVLRGEILKFSRKKILIFCGKGNNGKDGLALAKYLSERSYEVKVVAEVENEQEKIINDLLWSEVIVDALLGMGQVSAPYGEIRDKISLINSHLNCYKYRTKIVVSLDIPSGINSDSGEVYTPAIKANHTISVQWHKRGIFHGDAKDYVGSLHLVNIDLELKHPSEFKIYTPIKLPLKKQNVNKGSFGKIYILSGVRETTGATVLAGLSAWQAGASTVYLVDSPSSATYSGLTTYPSLMRKFIDTDSGAISSFLSSLNSDDILVIGPGFGLSADRKNFFFNLISSPVFAKNHITIIDADAISLLSELLDKINLSNQSNLIFTPHPKEAGRILNLTSTEIEKDRYKSFLALQEKFPGSVILLKGASTIVSSNFVHVHGNSKLAIAGSGDILAGIIAGLCSYLSFYDLELKAIVNFAVHIHSLLPTKIHKPFCSPLDLIDCIGLTLKEHA